MTLRYLSAACVLFAAGPALADCNWEWLCNGDGACKQMPVCDTLYDTPPPRPDSKPPAPPPVAMRPYAIPGTMGPATCEYIMRQTKSGRWTWAEACFCSDASKTSDPNAPLSNIVRCQAPWKE